METLSPLLTSLQRCCDALADLRRPGPNTRYTMADFGLAAFSVFFMQSPSFLAHQRHLEQGQGRSNCRSLFGMTAIPCDNQIRAMLDPVDPALFFPVFADVMPEFAVPRHTRKLVLRQCVVAKNHRREPYRRSHMCPGRPGQWRCLSFRGRTLRGF
jgi:hypothetical protein